MARARTTYVCGECGHEVLSWSGRCAGCGEWNTLVEQAAEPAAPKRGGGGARRAKAPRATRLREVELPRTQRLKTGIGELDRVLGGGLVPGSLVLLGGSPGIGKSTLTGMALGNVEAAGEKTLYISGEESAAQVRLRAGRTGGLDPDLWLAAETDLSAVLGHVEQVGPGLLVVDSVQTIASEAVEGTAGGLAQVRAVTATLVSLAKERALATVLVGHVTKDGAIAGPRTLEHLVDVVLQFEGERHSTLRTVRATKNRFGPADEVGCFALTDAGIVGLPDPSGLFLSRRPEPVAGTCVTVTVEGRRPLLAEVQALVGSAQRDVPPRRAVSGLDQPRVAMVLAVLERRAGVSLSRSDVYTATVGGMRLTEPATDLAVALAVAGAANDEVLPADLLAVGEVGLAGDVRPVGDLDRRLAEAARLGFRSALVPPGAAAQRDDMRVVEVADVTRALTAARALSTDNLRVLRRPVTAEAVTHP